MPTLALKNWDKTTSFLHAGLAITVTAQLLISQLMHHKVPHAFLLHQILGLAAIAIIILHWIWSSKTDEFPHLFPWSPQGLKAVRQDFKNLTHGHLPQSGKRPGLPGFVHGLGFLAVSAMAVTGGFFFLCLQLGYHPKWDLKIHSFFATFVWIYWIGHTFAVIFHHALDREKND